MSSLPSSPADSPQNEAMTGDDTSDTILSREVYGELVILISLGRNVGVKSLSFSTDCPDHLILFRKHASRTAAGKGRAVLERVRRDATTMESCFRNMHFPGH